MGEVTAEALGWAESAVGQRVVGSRGLRQGGAPWLLRFGDGAEAVLRGGDGFDTEVAALRLAEENGIPAPRLIAVGDGLMLLSVVAGSSRIPVEPTTERLTALGAAAAGVHAVELSPRKDLPLRHRPIELADFDRWRERDGASALLLDAVDAMAELPEPESARVLVHGDLWQGNTMWVGGELTSIVDWDCAGAGHHGVDLGSLRCDVELMFGVGAAEIVSAGWRERAGRPPADVAYWDVVAALATPPDLIDWEPAIQDQGRVDLDGATLTARRDAFLWAALDRIS
ncbi:aminoglycoside phosphotransferase family protein [Allokutzneria albata]|uniref:Predicted kinase, aminoglycoside phosphotransferase (APT) family n=1 Tax=Allokutzneria albata TaxID=211114 RepID=A0A1G9UXY9_ALLAB|nr:aminoglycoside phosphotransferase family protein [Allokutzneria albata]SDM64834.1 Predicted kinase, aminoglycoside phosphotransferase (APT) family [Allokutzneria albata]